MRRNAYCCGNTFFPTVHRERLPSHTVTDVGSLLVQAGLALPRMETGDSAYKQELRAAFDQSTAWINYPASGLVRRGDQAAIALGTSLIDRQSRLFVAGAYLLIAAQDVDAYPGIEREIRRRQQRNRDQYDASAKRDLPTSIPCWRGSMWKKPGSECSPRRHHPARLQWMQVSSGERTPRSLHRTATSPVSTVAFAS